MKKIKLLFFASFLSLLSFSASAVDITIARFFGDCEDAGSDTKATSGEACIIQSIINAFNEQKIKVLLIFVFFIFFMVFGRNEGK